jgi:multisubunit Na+/H+ antiporter MnhB subunit
MSKTNKIIIIGSVVTAASIILAYLAVKKLKKLKKNIEIAEAVLVGYLD